MRDARGSRKKPMTTTGDWGGFVRGARPSAACWLLERHRTVGSGHTSASSSLVVRWQVTEKFSTNVWCPPAAAAACRCMPPGRLLARSPDNYHPGYAIKAARARIYKAAKCDSASLPNGGLVPGKILWARCQAEAVVMCATAAADSATTRSTQVERMRVLNAMCG